MNDKQDLSTIALVLRKENKYLTKVISIALTVAVGAIGVVGVVQKESAKDSAARQEKATLANTAELKLLRTDLAEQNLVNNDRMNSIDNRLDIGREKSTSAFKEIKYRISGNTKRIDKLEARFAK